MARTVTIVVDALPVAQRVRVEALTLAIAMAPGRYPLVKDYLADALVVEAWLGAAGGAEDDLPEPREPLYEY